MNDTQWIDTLITAVATLTGSTLAFMSAIWINQKNMNNERLKQKEEISWEKDKLASDHKRLTDYSKLKVYNIVLKNDGEFLIIDYPSEFNIENYKEHIRPLLYEEFHLIDVQVRKIVREMDRLILVTEEIGFSELEDNQKLKDLYNKLIDEIERSYLNSGK